MILNKNRRFLNTTISKENEKYKETYIEQTKREVESQKRRDASRVNRGKERLWADTVGNRSDRSIDQSI